jgi:prepilin-type N-terminal cleavage/methylation domain-containing protein
MAHPPSRHRGFSMIELIVVMVIVAILSVVGITMLGNRDTAAVRSAMDEVEGCLMGAQKLSVSTGQDVIVGTNGQWVGTSPRAGVAPSMVMAYQQRTLATADELAALAANDPAAFRVSRFREHWNAGIIIGGIDSPEWTAALGPFKGLSNQDIMSVPPFSEASTGFSAILTSDKNLFTGAFNGSIRISGTNKRYATDFWIGVISLADGNPLPGGAMGLIVVQANGASVFKFYNPGVRSGSDGLWRRI